MLDLMFEVDGLVDVDELSYGMERGACPGTYLG